MGNVPFDKIINGWQDVFSIASVVVAISYVLVRFFNRYRIRSIYLYLTLLFLHCFVAFGYWQNSVSSYVDSNLYYSHVYNLDYGEGWLDYLDTGTPFITFIIYPLVTWAHLSYFSVFLLFSLVGFIGFLNVFKIYFELGGLKSISVIGLGVFPLFFMLPNHHIWTVAIGKDSLIFFSITLFFHALVSIKSRKRFFVLGLFLTFMIRPHVALMLILSLIFVVVLAHRNRILVYSIYIPLGVVCMFLGTSFMLKYMNSDASVLEVFSVLSDSADRYNTIYESSTGSGIDASGSSVLTKVFTYLFRPFFESRELSWILSSLENLVLLCIFISLIRVRFWKWLSGSPFVIKAMLFYFIIGILIMSSVSASNLGIMLRQKTMFVFVLYLLSLLYYSSLKNSRLEKSIKLNYDKVT